MDAGDRRDLSRPLEELHPNERLKAESDYLRGTVAEGLRDRVTGSISERDAQLVKFHGIYLQDDRDLRDERRRQKLEPAYQFMVRVRLPGGVCRPEQWLALERLAREHGDGTLRLTTRQTFQFHGILKRDLKATVRGINDALLDTIAACGDDNRGVMCAAHALDCPALAEIQALAKAVSERLIWRSRAYHEIWLDEERVAGGGEAEPLYGPTYLPRKFKIGFAVPPVNDIDVFSQDLGFIAIVEDGRLAGFDVCAGGGMGRADNEPSTYPRLADVIGSCSPEEVLEVAETVVAIQRDYGNRVDRKRARLKYTIDDRGVQWLVNELARRRGRPLAPARADRFEHNGDRYGWFPGAAGQWNYTLFIDNGRVRDTQGHALMTALREVAAIHAGDLRLTPNQNLIIAGVPAARREGIEAIMRRHGLRDPARYSPLRRSSMACVALPTCGLAMAESERYLPELVTKLERVMTDAGIGDEPIVVRMTGCPNGCVRPYLAEIGFTGRGPGLYDAYLGGAFDGSRLNKPWLDNVDEAAILERLTPIMHRYAAERHPGERFGDFVIRAGCVPEVEAGCA